MSEPTILDANFPPASVVDDAVGVPTPSFQPMIDDITQTAGYKEVMDDITGGRMTFQRAFMSGSMQVKGDFNMLRMLDTVFEFK